jgi:oligoendopeptidase F
MKKRSEIPEKYKWSFSDYFQSDDDWAKAYDEFSNELLEVKNFYGKLTEKQSILGCLKLLEKLSCHAEALFIYANCMSNIDVANPKYQAYIGKIGQKLAEKSEMCSFIVPQLCQLSDEFLNDVLHDKTFCDFKSFLREVQKEKAHILPEESEKLLSSSSSFAEGFSANFSNFEDADLKFKDVKNSKGKSFKMSSSLAMTYLESPDSTLRDNAYRELQSAFGRFNNFLTSNYLSSAKKDVFYARARHFSSALDSSLFNEEVGKNVYENLVKNVEKNLNLNQKYFELKRKLLGLKTFKLSDLFFYPFKLSSRYTYDLALETVYSALSVLGEDYVEKLKFMAENQMIDAFPTQNKTSGAYETMASKKSPRVLTNFMGTYNDVSTLAHELGHAMHSVYSRDSQSIFNASYTIFLAEIASTVNELLLSEFMLKKSTSDDEKLYYINQFLSAVYTTIFRQTMFASFEEIVHTKVEKNEELSTVVLNQTYLQLVKKYFGKKVKIFDEVKFEWSRIPHFYNAFYVYKYATGLISAINIVSNLNSGAITVADYKKFLSSGCTDIPTELLKIVGVNYDTEEPFLRAFEFIGEKLKAFEMLEKNKKY